MNLAMSVPEAAAAVAEGADYIGVGSVFASPTKPQVHPAGAELIAAVRRTCQRPIIAIGGLNADNVAEAMAAGADGAAICRAIIGSADPGGAVRQIRGRLGTDS